MTGKRGLAAVFPIGVRQQSVYQRMTPFSERRIPYGVRTRGQFHARRWHLEDVRPSSGVEHVWPLQEACERLTVLAVADE
jgi:hypothetical protein